MLQVIIYPGTRAKNTSQSLLKLKKRFVQIGSSGTQRVRDGAKTPA